MFVQHVNQLAINGLLPDYTFWLDIAPARAFERLGTDGFDKIESIGTVFYDKLVKGYLQVYLKNPQRVYPINADQPQDKVFLDIKSVLAEKLRL